MVAMFNEDLVHVQSAETSHRSLATYRQLYDGTGVMHRFVFLHIGLWLQVTEPTRYTRVCLRQHRHTRHVLLDSSVVRNCKELGIFHFRGSRGGQQHRVHVIIR